MSERSASPPVGRILAALLFTLTSTLCGATLGGLYVRLFTSRPEMGWDGIANLVGGLGAGAAFGLVAGAALASALSTRGRLVGAAVAALVAAAIVAGLAVL